jgi:hypothetical protein
LEKKKRRDGMATKTFCDICDTEVNGRTAGDVSQRGIVQMLSNGKAVTITVTASLNGKNTALCEGCGAKAIKKYMEEDRHR